MVYFRNLTANREWCVLTEADLWEVIETEGTAKNERVIIFY